MLYGNSFLEKKNPVAEGDNYLNYTGSHTQDAKVTASSLLRAVPAHKWK